MEFFVHIKNVFRREIERFGQYPTFLTLSIVLPIIAFLFFVLLFKSGVPRDLPIAVYDMDNTPLSRKVARMIDATPSALVAYEVTSMDEGERLMKQGKIDAIVSLPRDMERDIYRNAQIDVVAYVSGVNVSKNGLLERDIRTALTTFSSGIQIQMLMKKGRSEAEAYQLMMPIYFERHILFNPYTNYMYYLIPIFLPMMLLIFTILTTVFAFGVELKNGTAAKWLETAGGSVVAAVSGKALPYTVLFSILSILTNTIMFKYLGVPLNGDRTMLLLSGVVFIMAYQGIAIFIVMLMSNLRLALSLGGGYSVLAFTFSGLTFPIMAMSTPMKIFSFFFPLTYYMDIFIDQAMRGAPVALSLKYVGFLMLFILLPLTLTKHIRRVCSDPKYWGRI